MLLRFVNWFWSCLQPLVNLLLRQDASLIRLPNQAGKQIVVIIVCLHGEHWASSTMQPSFYRFTLMVVFRPDDWRYDGRFSSPRVLTVRLCIDLLTQITSCRSLRSYFACLPEATQNHWFLVRKDQFVRAVLRSLGFITAIRFTLASHLVDLRQWLEQGWLPAAALFWNTLFAIELVRDKIDVAHGL